MLYIRQPWLDCKVCKVSLHFSIGICYPLLCSCVLPCSINSLWPSWNGRHFADDIFNRIFLNKNVLISIKISLKFVPKGPINNIPALVQIMAWRRPGDKPLSEPVMVRLLTHICVTRPQWVNLSHDISSIFGQYNDINIHIYIYTHI